MPTVGDAIRSRVDLWADAAKQQMRFAEIGKRWAIELIRDFGYGLAADPIFQWEIPVGALKNFLKAVLPTLKFLAGITTTPIDDQFVAVLEAWLNQGAGQPFHEFAATYKP